MGVYIYKIGSPGTLRVAMKDGQEVSFAPYMYVYKPYHTWDGEEINARFERKLIDPTRRAWERSEKERPSFAVDADDDGKYRDGAGVIEWNPRRVSSDDYDFNEIGILRKRGRRWVIDATRKPSEKTLRADVLVDGYGVLTAGVYTLSIPKDYDWAKIKPEDIALDDSIEVVSVKALEGARA